MSHERTTDSTRSTPHPPTDPTTTASVTGPSTHLPNLVKTLRRGDIVLFIVAAVISADSIAVLASGGLEGVTWAAIIGVAFLVPYAMVFAETAAAHPAEGGPYQWVSLAFGRVWAAVASMLYWITNPIWLGGSLAFIAGAVWSQYVVTTAEGGWGDYAFKLAFVWIAILLAIISLRRGKLLINAGAIVKLLVLVSLSITAALQVAREGLGGLNLGTAAPTVTGFLAIVPIALFSYVGFEAPSAASEEMHDAQRDTPVAIARGAAITLLAYVVPVLAIVLVTPTDQMADVGVMQTIESTYDIYGAAAGPLVTITALGFIFALLTQGSAWMMATDRMQAVAAADGAFFTPRLGAFHPTLSTPVRMNVCSGIVSTVFLLAAMTLVDGSVGAVFVVVLTVAVSTLLLSYLIVVPALIKLRRTADIERPYQVPGGRRGFTVLAAIVLLFVLMGSVQAVFPGTLETLFGLEYSFVEEWGVTRTNFELFTLGTLVVVTAVSLLGCQRGNPQRHEHEGGART